MNTKLSIKKLKGIKPKGVKAKETSTLERIFEIEKKIIADRRAEIGNRPLDPDAFDNVYDVLYSDFKNNYCNDFEYGPQHLKDYVCGQMNFTETGFASSITSVLRGMYSGALLELLCRRTNESGKKFRFEVDGAGNQFDYLFHYARFVDELIIENFKGDDLCSNMLNRAGKGELILVKDCKGTVGSFAQSAKSANLLVISGSFSPRWTPADGGNSQVDTVISLDGVNKLNDFYFQNSDDANNLFVSKHKFAKKLLTEKKRSGREFEFLPIENESLLLLSFYFSSKQISGGWRFEDNQKYNSFDDLKFKERRIEETISQESDAPDIHFGYFQEKVTQRKLSLKGDSWKSPEKMSWTSLLVDDKKALKLYNDLVREFRFDEIIHHTLLMSKQSKEVIEYHSKKIHEIGQEVKEKYKDVKIE
ncbi:hypothetical protein HOK51_07675 [Candidatus Woesearchaeota archaeon]|jgi:hypothetical protein|nr:hypothetical protein [Candidatus Woesearchaeota archaeon]MBT6519703.1 hypothetical protein [Candidatus Woesearchaeota archaeon]MBT7367394.1 hypothetical protein [Candidatus Woesearchaeota archaeon]